VIEMEKKVYETIGNRIPIRLYCKVRKDGEHYLTMNVRNNDGIISLNNTAKEVLDLCDGKRSLSEIFRILKDKYCIVDDAEIKFDIASCIRDLESMYLIKYLPFPY